MAEDTADAEAPSRRAAIRTLALGMGAAATAASTPAPGAAGPMGDRDLLVTDFGARGDGSSDDTTAFERAISAAMSGGRRLRIPAGRYRIARTLTVTRGIRVEGDGVERTILLGGMGEGRPLLHLHAKETDSIMGAGVSGMTLDGAHGKGPCDGIRISTAGGGAAVHQATIRDLLIINIGTGIALSGVVYRSCFDNITVTGKVTRYGFYCDQGFEDVTYNSFWNLEVTNVGDGAHAFWIHSNYSNFLNLTSDGCSYFSSPGGTITNLAVEGVFARKPPSDMVVRFNQIQSVRGLNLIRIDPRRCSRGIHVIGQAVVLHGIRCIGMQPAQLFSLDPLSEGAIAGVQTEQPSAMMEDYVPAATLRRWDIHAARSVARRGA